VKALIAANADLTAKDQSGYTPLAASMTHHPDVADTLMAAKAARLSAAEKLDSDIAFLLSSEWHYAGSQRVGDAYMKKLNAVASLDDRMLLERLRQTFGPTTSPSRRVSRINKIARVRLFMTDKLVESHLGHTQLGITQTGLSAKYMDEKTREYFSTSQGEAITYRISGGKLARPMVLTFRTSFVDKSSGVAKFQEAEDGVSSIITMMLLQFPQTVLATLALNATTETDTENDGVGHAAVFLLKDINLLTKLQMDKGILSSAARLRLECLTGAASPYVCSPYKKY
jgi:hypothetical protein